MIEGRKVREGNKMDNSANELFHEHIKDMCRAFAMVDGRQAAARKLAVKTLWYSAGRSSEPSFMMYDGLRWNVLHNTAVIESYQSKPNKLKFVAFVAGVDRHSDWLIDLGDHLILDYGGTVYQPGQKAALLPDLDGTGAGTKLSNYIKGVQPDGRPGSLKAYSEVKGGGAASLPPQPTAAGVRPGAADTLACAVPAELGVHNTGHDLTGLSCLWEYLQGRVALTIPGVLVLSGWPPFPYGHLGKGPQHSTLDALIGIPSESLETFINELFCFRPGKPHPPMLLIGGELRPMMRAIMATLLMYYEQRCLAEEMNTVSKAMRAAYKASIAAPYEDPHAKLIEWGTHIKARFDVDNLHLTSRLKAMMAQRRLW
jgi:hypothetical protein